MEAVIQQIQDPGLKKVILDSVNEVTTLAAQGGYGGLFYSAVVIAVLILIVTFILAPIRKRNLLVEKP